MPRHLAIGNGSLLVEFDSCYRLADLYYPRVGMENHAASRFRFGVWADGSLRWVEGPDWKLSLHYLRDTLVTDVTCENPTLGIRIHCYDAVDIDHDVFLRKLVVRNQRDGKREVKLFLHHDLGLYGNPIGDTAMYDPVSGAILHYKVNRWFLINAGTESHTGVTEYACGRSGIGSGDGTWRDAEDGALAMTPVAQGSVDSTIAIALTLEPLGSATLFYWICAGRSMREVRALDRRLREETPQRALARTASYWYTWVNKPGTDLDGLPDEIGDLYRRSLLVLTTQIDRGGAVLAANDSDIQWGHNDHYSYVWPRDSAFVCDALDRAGFPEYTRRFLRFAHAVIEEEGYFLHKYHPDGSLASLWHPWVRDGRPQLPIQEDETALVIWLAARHYARNRDLELAREIYERLVVRPAEFLLSFRDASTALPLPSIDLWEERQGVFFFTACSVVAGLQAAAELAGLFNEQDRRARWAEAAAQIREAIVRHFWLEAEQRFARGYLLSGERLELDTTVDASAFACFYLGVFPAGSTMVEGTMRAIRERLWVRTATGGIARYEGDAYHRISDDPARVPGNPWILCTLWLAEHSIARARSAGELQSALDLVRWVRSKALPSLVLPEQINPYDGSPLSVAPFTWSHAQLVSVVQSYLAAHRRMRETRGEDASESGVQTGRANPVDNP